MENFSRDGNTRPPYLPPGKPTQVKKTVRIVYGTMDWFKIGKEICQGCVLSPCLFNLHAESIMQNAGLDEAQAGIKIAGRYINNLKYADYTTLMAERSGTKEPLHEGEREEGESWLKTQYSKIETMASSPIIHGR